MIETDEELDKETDVVNIGFKEKLWKGLLAFNIDTLTSTSNHKQSKGVKLHFISIDNTRVIKHWKGHTIDRYLWTNKNYATALELLKKKLQ